MPSAPFVVPPCSNHQKLNSLFYNDGSLRCLWQGLLSIISKEMVMSRAQSTVYPCTKHQVRNQTEELSGLQKDHGHGWSSNIEIALIPMQRRAGMRRGAMISAHAVAPPCTTSLCHCIMVMSLILDACKLCILSLCGAAHASAHYVAPFCIKHY